MTPQGSLVCLSPVSTIITEWVWVAKFQRLFVTWGETEYQYHEVPFSTIHAMMSADSLAKFLNAEVKPNYTAEKV